MTQRVVPLDLEAHWDPNCEGAVLASTDDPDLGSRAVLALGPHPSGDADRRCVVLVWDGCAHAELGSPNDHAISHHPLYRSGLDNVLWAGEVLDSERAIELSRMSAWPPRRHFIVRTKGSVAEVIADTIRVERRTGSQVEVALSTLREGTRRHRA